MAIIERPKRVYRKRIPYGMQNFEDVMEEDCYYVDKTPFIEVLEDSHMYFFFIRPRRFGKTLTISMLENYYDINKKDKFESRLAYDGAYREYFDFIADTLKRHSSQRDKQKGEAYVHGFTLAMTCQNKFYRPISELDTDGGYADIFLLPLCDIYKDMRDSYIIELKYSKTSTTDEQVARLFEDASAQVERYAASDMVRDAVKTTTLHKVVVIYRDAEMVACGETGQ